MTLSAQKRCKFCGGTGQVCVLYRALDHSVNEWCGCKFGIAGKSRDEALEEAAKRLEDMPNPACECRNCWLRKLFAKDIRSLKSTEKGTKERSYQIDK